MLGYLGCIAALLCPIGFGRSRADTASATLRGQTPSSLTLLSDQGCPVSSLPSAVMQSLTRSCRQHTGWHRADVLCPVWTERLLATDAGSIGLHA